MVHVLLSIAGGGRIAGDTWVMMAEKPCVEQPAETPQTAGDDAYTGQREIPDAIGRPGKIVVQGTRWLR